jgi:hypothetical protein
MTEAETEIEVEVEAGAGADPPLGNLLFLFSFCVFLDLLRPFLERIK